jgi:hypothetical protein
VKIPADLRGLSESSFEAMPPLECDTAPRQGGNDSAASPSREQNLELTYELGIPAYRAPNGIGTHLFGTKAAIQFP